MPAGALLKSVMDKTERRSPLILTNSYGRPRTSDGFRTSWSKACDRAGIDEFTFHDLRGTAVVRLAVAGAIMPQIATFGASSFCVCPFNDDATHLKPNQAVDFKEANLGVLSKRVEIIA
ncbi:hypothetical protein ACVIGA_001808 [Bradyrhizobium sp. USDA 3240]